MLSVRPAVPILTRVLLVILGGYAASAGIVATLAVTLPLVGMERSEAVVFSPMAGFIVYLLLLLWGFAERRLWLVGIGLGMTSLASFGIASSIGSGG